MATKVLVLDDDPASRQALVRTILAAGHSPVEANGPFATLDALCEHAIALEVSHVVTDHRLRERPFTGFLGARAASVLYGLKIAPVLITAFVSQDMDLNIRPFLNHIPQVVKRGDRPVSPGVLSHALQVSADEVILGRVPRARRSYRSVVHVADIVRPQEGIQLRLEVKQWRKGVTVGFPLESVPKEIKPSISVGSFFLAQVNIEADSAETLFFTDFETAPEEDGHGI